MTNQQLFQSALQLHQAGRPAEAERLYRQILAQDPRHAEAAHMLGVIALQAGNFPQAVQLIGDAIRLNPDSALAHSNLGMALASLGKREEAVEELRKALSIKSDLVQAWENLGTAQRELGRFDEAAAALGKAAGLRPANPDLLNKLGTALMEAQRIDQAVQAFSQALRLRPQFVEAMNNLGLALHEKGESQPAIQTFEQAIALKPTSPEPYNNLATTLLREKRGDEAIPLLRQALALRPSYPEAHYNLGNALLAGNQPDAAAIEYRRALTARPDYVQALHNLANALKEIGNFDEAIECYRKAIAMGFDTFEVYSNLGTTLRVVGELDESIACFHRAVQLKPCCDAAESLLYSIHFHPDYDAAKIYEEHKRWNLTCAQALEERSEPFRNDRSLDRRLRVGYVSPDFRRHPVGGFLLPLLANHDHERFEIFCYSDVRRPDPLTGELRVMTDAWRDVANLTDVELCKLVRSDGIDILVDLALHTDHSRMLAFARKPAPVQVTYLAYCSTSGLSAIDYRLTDPFLDPPGGDDSVYSEKSLRLPATYWCYQPRPEAPPVAMPPVCTSGAITFGCLNNFAKVTAPMLHAWRRILLLVPNSRLILHSPQGNHRQKLRDHFAADGIAPPRLQFVDYLPLAQYFEQYHQIDIALDTSPYTGGTTTCDALWMGVPVVTLEGGTAVSRAGKSILANVGMPDLVAESVDHYIRLATDLAADVQRLSTLRAGMRQRMTNSPLMNTQQFARDIEAAYRAMWQESLRRSEPG